MSSQPFRHGAFARAYVMAALLALISLCVIAPRAEAHVRHHRWHHVHHRRIAWRYHWHRYARVNRGWFTEVTQGSLFEPPAPPALVFDQRVIHPVREAARGLATHASGILREAAKFIGDGNITGHRGPWCKWFVNLVLKRTGHYWQPSGRAIDARYLGPPTRPHPGVIAYTAHHTGFVAEVDERHFRVLLLGGNQGHRVSFLWHSMRGMHFVEPI